jgi:hypothetical protein
MKLLALVLFLFLGATLSWAQPDDKEEKKPLPPQLKQFDTNQGGKIAKDEARGKLADTFALVD